MTQLPLLNITSFMQHTSINYGEDLTHCPCSFGFFISLTTFISFLDDSTFPSYTYSITSYAFKIDYAIPFHSKGNNSLSHATI